MKPYSEDMINTVMLIESAHAVLLDTVDGLSTTDWHRAPLDGAWTNRDVVAHLTTLDEMLIELVQPAGLATPLLSGFCASRPQFNTESVGRYAEWPFVALFSQFEQVHDTLVKHLVGQSLDDPVPHYRLRRYGRTVADCVVTFGYGHKLVCATQIGTFRQLHKYEQGLRIEQNRSS